MTYKTTKRNTFKGLEVNERDLTKGTPTVMIIVTMVIIFLFLAGLHGMGIIELSVLNPE